MPVAFLSIAQNLSHATGELLPTCRASHCQDLSYLISAAVHFIQLTLAKQFAFSPFLQVEIERASASSELLFPVPLFLMLLLLSRDCPPHSAAPNFARCFLSLYYFCPLVFVCTRSTLTSSTPSDDAALGQSLGCLT